MVLQKEQIMDQPREKGVTAMAASWSHQLRFSLGIVRDGALVTTAALPAGPTQSRAAVAMPQRPGRRQHPTGGQSPAEEAPVESLAPEGSTDVDAGRAREQQELFGMDGAGRFHRSCTAHAPMGASSQSRRIYGEEELCAEYMYLFYAISFLSPFSSFPSLPLPLFRFLFSSQVFLSSKINQSSRQTWGHGTLFRMMPV
ncbi:hypothetical protein ETB97_008828 [Aspergillus alliaceus]|uniref:Uncharacterized protein n=1 Tax=Petromyces alliaceus TaxID=209559 RepID=A0A8H5ZV07_PETAA|nr:hypothetical protein ETB97_008828 [Aspergillus burnettii]